MIFVYSLLTAIYFFGIYILYTLSYPEQWSQLSIKKQALKIIEAILWPVHISIIGILILMDIIMCWNIPKFNSDIE